MAPIENSFQAIAHVYHRFNNNDIYPEWLKFTLDQSQNQLKKVLDLACGNGEFIRRLAPYCQEISAVDYDSAMIDMARSLTSAEAAISYYCLDMRQLTQLKRQFSLITCFLDAFCFLPGQDDLEVSFSQIYQSLTPQGILLFDVWTLAGLSKFADFEYADLDDQAALIWQSNLLNPQTVVHQVTVFDQVHQEDYRRISVNLVEQTFPLETYLDLLVEAGFSRDNIEIFIDLQGTSYQGEDELEVGHDRWFIKAVK
ncbi:methyltransferase domain-containing protein [Ignavigranum ruoffiae]|uniref:class I SAM-dependent DNA methyltransferase n=1 Tax=Ignavigranum ruoffiae TaxID=89093 RepID=UPI003B00DFA7